MRIIRHFWRDQVGIVVSMELVLGAAALVIGILVGLSAIQHSASYELNDVAAAVGAVNQSYSVSTIIGHTASTSGSRFDDRVDPEGLLGGGPPGDESPPGGGGSPGDESPPGGGGPPGDDSPPSGGGGDALTQGYWKNHSEQWPVDSLTLGSETYSKQEALAILGTPSQGDASLILAHQLIAAKLNVASGVDAGSIAGAINTADALLGSFGGKLPYGVSPATPVGQDMVNTATQLDNFNNGN